METSYKPSRAWRFIIASLVLLAAFLINSLLLAGETGTQSTNSLPLNTVLSFLFASAALTTAVASNVAAFMNPTSTQTMKITSPIILALSFIAVAPFFIAFGLTLTT